MKKAKRFLSMLLTLCFVLGLCPSMALAADSMAYSIGGAPPTAGFADVKSDDWYYDAVLYAYGNGIMSGTSANAFSPNTTTTRGMVVSVLHRMEGTPSADKANFADVANNQYYTNAVAWASANGIVSGYTNGMFGPNDTITREQMASILYRYAQHKGYDTSASGSLASFADADQVNSYAAGAMAWAVGNGLISGVGQNTLAPQGNASRAQTAAILMRFQQAHALNSAEDAQPETDSSETETYTVVFELNYDNEGTYRTMTVSAGDKVQLPPSPSRDGYTFRGWYMSASGGKEFDASKPVTGDITLYASWKKDAATTGGSSRGSRGGTFSGYGGSGSSSSSGSSGSSGSASVTPPTSSGNYTVTFNSNGGSSVAAQSIRPGECAVQPDDPTRDGYTFVGWYTSSDLITLYNFSSAVASDITLYARWAQQGEEVHTFLDDPDPDVEIYSFTTDTWDILVGSTETVTFTAEVFANIELGSRDIAVVGDNGTTVGYMHDDGLNGDETAFDGIYTLQSNLSSPFAAGEVGVVNYHVQAGDAASPNDIGVCYYREITDAEFDCLYAIMDDLAGMTNIDDVCKYLENHSEVASFEVSEDDQIVSFKLTSALVGTWEAQPFENDMKGAGNSASESAEDSDLPAPFAAISDGKLAVGSDVLVLRPFRGTQFRYDDFRDDGAALSGELDGNLSVRDDADADVNAFQSFDSYGVILVDSHGTKYGENPYILTGEAAPRNRNSADWTAERLIAAAGRVCVGSGFFEKYYPQNSLENSVFFLGTCYSLYNNSIANALINKGANVVFGYREPVTIWYCNDTLHETMVVQMAQDQSAREAYDAAIRKYGTTAADYQMRGTASFSLYADEAEGTMAGSVKRAQDRGAVPNALIRIYDEDGNYLEQIRTDSNGTYSHAMPAGNYVIKVTAGHYKSAKMAVTVTENTTVYTETLLLLDAGLTQGYVNGRITSAIVSEQGVPGITLRLRWGWNNRNGVVLQTGTTNEDGYYEFSILSGVYTMEYAKSGYVTGYKNILVGPLDLAAQNAVISPLTSENEYRIILSWSDHPRDLDAHLAGPVSDGTRFHLYYPYADTNSGSRYPNDFTLDLDNVEMPARQDPETITIIQQHAGKYVYSVHDFSNGGRASSLDMATSNATVTVLKGGMRVAVFHVPAGIAGTIWTVFELEGDQITPINRIGNGYSNDPSFDPYRDSMQVDLMDSDLEKWKKPENVLVEDENLAQAEAGESAQETEQAEAGESAQETEQAEADESTQETEQDEAGESTQETAGQDAPETPEPTADDKNPAGSEENADVKDPEPSETTADDTGAGDSEAETPAEDAGTSEIVQNGSNPDDSETSETNDIETDAGHNENETVGDTESLSDTET